MADNEDDTEDTGADTSDTGATAAPRGLAPPAFVPNDQGGEQGEGDQGSGGQDQSFLQRALNAVDAVIDFGRQKHGIGQDEGQQAQPGPDGQQMDQSGSFPRQTKSQYPQGQGVIGFDEGGVVPDELDNPSGVGYVPEQEGAIQFPNPDDSGDQNTPGVGYTPEQTPDVSRLNPANAVGPGVQYQTQAQRQPQGPQDVGTTDTGGNDQAMATYALGLDGAQPQEVQAAEQQADPDGQMDDHTRKLATVANATEQGGPEAGYAVAQRYRARYEQARILAATTATTDPLKTAHTANLAMSNLLNETTVKFAPTAGGYDATVAKVGGGTIGRVTLTPPQMEQFLKGGTSQFDNMRETGVLSALQTASQGQMHTAPGGDQPQGQPFQGQQLPFMPGNKNPQGASPSQTQQGDQSQGSLQDILREIDKAYPTAGGSQQKALARANAIQEFSKNQNTIRGKQMQLDAMRGRTELTEAGKDRRSAASISGKQAAAQILEDGRSNRALQSAATRLQIAKQNNDTRSAVAAQNVMRGIITSQLSNMQGAPDIESTTDEIMKHYGMGQNAPAPQGGGQQPAVPGGVPAPGTVKNGYKFMGGDPSKQASWQKVQ